MKWDESFDVLVVGSGAAGLTAALTAQLKGLSTIVLEKTDTYGGSSALSNGAIWVPNNHYLQEVGVVDSPEEALAYLNATVGNRVSSELKESYIKRGPEMLRFLHDKTNHMRFEYTLGYPDYYPEKPGGMLNGRSIEPLKFDLRKLGKLNKTLRRSSLAKNGLVMNSYEFHKVNMIKRTKNGKKTLLKLILQLIKAKLTGSRYVALGEALIARLRLSLHEAGGDVWLSMKFKDYVMENGKIAGLIVERSGTTLHIEAKRGVILASGGFSHNRILREKYLPSPTSVSWTSAAVGQTGDILEASIQIGAKLDLMDKVWGAPSAVPPKEKPFFLVADRGVPNMIVVNNSGQRYINEAAPYHEFVNQMYANDEPTGNSVPSWMILDQTARNRYNFMGLLPGQKFPMRWFESLYIKKADTIAALAEKMNVPVKNLSATVVRYNKFAKAGKDEDFKRGDSAYDRYYGDPTLPNPNLGVLAKAPFYAIPIYPGDIGTKGGLVIDPYSRVLIEEGTPIKGLYAAGNCSASVMGESEPGPGAILGPAMTFGYIAASHLVEAETTLANEKFVPELIF